MKLPQHVRAETAAAQEAEKRRREAERAQKAMQRSQKAQEKETKLQYQAAREAEVVTMNDSLAVTVGILKGILAQTLDVDDYVSFESLKDNAELPAFEPGKLGLEEPAPPLPHPVVPMFQPEEPSWVHRLVPGWKKKHEAALASARADHEQEVRRVEEEAKTEHAKAMEARNDREAARLKQLDVARVEHEVTVQQLERERISQHAEVDAFEQRFRAGDREAIERYFSLVLSRSPYPSILDGAFRLAFVPDSNQLVVEKDLPEFSVVPEAREFRYVRAKDEVAASSRPMTDRKSIYASVVGQVVLRTLHELFEADREQRVETIVLNAFVNTIDARTGQEIRPCLITLRTSRETFNALDLTRVEPLACLRALNAGVSKSPAELVPVRPVLEFSMVDPRFVQEGDVLSTLDQRPNLYELTPTEFEELITNLFEKMGLETRMTQASRDGGVDCVAYDPRPIFGGKVVIQAKRYKNTVGVSAVRDLFGTMQNEGASKGILVTTSGYGRAAFEFADGKPMELLSGSNLLYLLQEHAGLEARIEVPDDWEDPLPPS